MIVCPNPWTSQRPGPGSFEGVTSTWDGPDLARSRAASPLAPLVPLATALLGPAAHEAGLAVVVADAAARPLWVEAEPGVRAALESRGLRLGEPFTRLTPVWERRAPLRSAPARAARTGEGPDVGHAPSVEGYCAAPVKDPRTGELSGILAITGGAAAADGFALAALRGTAAVLESHLATRAATADAATPVGSASSLALLRLTGPDAPTLDTPYGTSPLNLRHAELLAVLVEAPAGLSGNELAERLFSTPLSSVTLRAEITRLRRALEFSGALEAGVGFTSRPYRLTGVETDEARIGSLLDRGALERALTEYGGRLLPASDAPELVRRRKRLSAALRGAVLSSSSLSPLLTWLRLEEAEQDLQAWQRAAELVPASSPHHSRIQAHLAGLRE